MKAKVEKVTGCGRIIKIEVSSEELSQKFDQVYTDIGKTARIPGFRPGKAPRDLLQKHHGKVAEEEVLKRVIPEYYLKAIREENLIPVAPPEIEDVRFEKQILLFSAKVDIQPQIKLKNYRNLPVTKRKLKVEDNQIERVLENLRQSRAKDKVLPELDDRLAQDLGYKNLPDLKEVIKKNLAANAEVEVRMDMERQILNQLIQKASLDVPESLLKHQTQELLNQIKLNWNLQKEKKEDLQSKEKEFEQQARKEATRRVKLSFILDEIAKKENIQVQEKDLDQRIKEIAQHAGKSEDEVKQYLNMQNLIPGLKAELRDKKTMEFLLNEANIKEEVN